jgi:hypothetical protein
MDDKTQLEKERINRETSLTNQSNLPRYDKEHRRDQDYKVSIRKTRRDW